jgi:hypothetical protein
VCVYVCVCARLRACVRMTGSNVGRGGRSASRSGSWSFWGVYPDVQSVWGLVGPRPRLNGLQWRRIFCVSRQSNYEFSGGPGYSLVTILSGEERSRVMMVVVQCWQSGLGGQVSLCFVLPFLVVTMRDFPGHCSRVCVATFGRDHGSD